MNILKYRRQEPESRSRNPEARIQNKDINKDVHSGFFNLLNMEELYG
jgi:hypothetical protein